MAAITTATTTNLFLLRRLLHRPLHFTTTTTFSLLHSKPSLSLSSTPAFSSSTSPQTLTLETDIHLQQQQPPPQFDLNSNNSNSNSNGNGNGNGDSNGRNVTVLDEKRKVPDLSAKEKNEEICSYAKLKSQQIDNSNCNCNGNGNGNGRNVTLLDEKRKVPDSLGDKLKSQQIGNVNGNGNNNGNSTSNGDDNGRNVTALDGKRKVPDSLGDKLQSQHNGNSNGNGNGNSNNNSNNNGNNNGNGRKVPELTVKEKKELGSYANSLGDKLKSQQIGKSGVTDNVAFALSETLEKNELLKLKIHKSCPGEWEDTVKQVEQATGSVVVGQIGRTIILYRPSVSKLKAEEKRELHRKIFAQRKHKAKIAFMNQRKDQMSRQPRRGRNRRLEKIES